MDYNKIITKNTFIFDVDGTLYSQPKMRIKMAFDLALYYGLHFWRAKEFLLLYYFRKLRETEKYRTKSITEQIFAACKKVSLPENIGRGVIDKWMFSKPLDVMKQCAFPGIAEFVADMQSKGKRVYIYSDYAAEEKLSVLGIAPDGIYTPENPGVSELKPSRKAMDYIMSELKASAEDVLFVGDRDEKDGKSAEYAGVDYCRIDDFLKALRQKI